VNSYKAGLRIDDDIEWIHKQIHALDEADLGMIAEKTSRRRQTDGEAQTIKSVADDCVIFTLPSQAERENFLWFNNPLFSRSQSDQR
jgi:hypothetical protein